MYSSGNIRFNILYEEHLVWICLIHFENSWFYTRGYSNLKVWCEAVCTTWISGSRTEGKAWRRCWPKCWLAEFSAHVIFNPRPPARQSFLSKLWQSVSTCTGRNQLPWKLPKVLQTWAKNHWHLKSGSMKHAPKSVIQDLSMQPWVLVAEIIIFSSNIFLSESTMMETLTNIHLQNGPEC